MKLLRRWWWVCILILLAGVVLFWQYNQQAEITTVIEKSKSMNYLTGKEQPYLFGFSDDLKTNVSDSQKSFQRSDENLVKISIDKSDEDNLMITPIRPNGNSVTFAGVVIDSSEKTFKNSINLTFDFSESKFKEQFSDLKKGQILKLTESSVDQIPTEINNGLTAKLNSPGLYVVIVK